MSVRRAAGDLGSKLVAFVTIAADNVHICIDRVNSGDGQVPGVRVKYTCFDGEHSCSFVPDVWGDKRKYLAAREAVMSSLSDISKKIGKREKDIKVRNSLDWKYE